MGKTSIEKVKDWEALSEAVAKIYLKIIDCEKRGDLGKEYKDLLYILPTALRFEKQRFLEMGLCETNYQSLKKHFDISSAEVVDVTDGYDANFPLFRKHNYFTSMLNLYYGGFYRIRETRGIQDFVNNQNELRTLQNEIFTEHYHTQVTVNFIQMLESYINCTEDEDVRNYLIYIKYLMIATVPKYEEDYVLFGEKLLPIRDILKTFPVTDGYTEEEIKILTEQSLRKDLISELSTMIQINNFIFPYYKRTIYKELALNKARLISLNNEEFINSIKDEITKQMRVDNDFYTEINKLVREMFDDAKRILSEGQIKKVL